MEPLFLSLSLLQWPQGIISTQLCVRGTGKSNRIQKIIAQRNDRNTKPWSCFSVIHGCISKEPQISQGRWFAHVTLSHQWPSCSAFMNKLSQNTLSCSNFYLLLLLQLLFYAEKNKVNMMGRCQLFFFYLLSACEVPVIIWKITNHFFLNYE